MNTLNNIKGSLIGGAIGDALGAPVEFHSLKSILSTFPDGVQSYSPAYGKVGAITDDTQMLLFTAEGIIEFFKKYPHQSIDYFSVEPETELIRYIHMSYLDWLSTQNRYISDNNLFKNELLNVPELKSNRAPGGTCLSALNSGNCGTINNPLNNSKGCGGVMRVAPVGLVFRPEIAFKVGCNSAVITHGHPDGYLPAGIMACLLSLMKCHPTLHLTELIEITTDIATTQFKSYKKSGTYKCIQEALLAYNKGNLSYSIVESLGGGWVGDEAFAISLYCVLAADGDFMKCMKYAVTHSGDTDSTGAIAGNIIGLDLGYDNLPDELRMKVELHDVLLNVATELNQMSITPPRRAGLE